MFITVKIRSLVKPAIAVATVVLFASIVFFAFSGKSVGVLGPYNCHSLLIDAGHGGIDGGAKASKKAMLTLRLLSECPGYVISSA